MTIRSHPVAKQQVETDQLMGAVAQAQLSALLLDYDGTLAPFCANRQAALPYLGVVPVLREIIATGRTRVVIVSGRSAPDVVPLLGMYPIPEVWGAHGLQRLRPDGNCELAELHENVLQALSDTQEWLTEQGLEQFAERKPGGVAVHWRGLSAANAAEIRERVLRGWFPAAQSTSMSVLEFDGGVEIRAPGIDKGDAVRTIMSELDFETPIAYLGDDATDEPAFKALGARGLSILVRPEWRRTAARIWLKPPDDLLDFLTRWLQACRETRAPGRDSALYQRNDR
ncbi:MAG: trehalose-phosphatase [Terriglobales bacterium]